MQKAYQELDEVVGRNNSVEEFHLLKLQLLDAVMEEKLRLHLALPLSVPHISRQSCTLGRRICPGVPLAERMFVFTLASLMHSFEWKLQDGTEEIKKAIPPLRPGPRGLPVVGYLPFLSTELHKKFTELAGVYGPIYKLWLGKKLCVVVSSQSAAKEILRDQDATFGNRDAPIVGRIISYGGSDIAWSSMGPAWKKMRKDTVLGGTDTTSTMVEWVIAELMQNQEVMEKVHQELDEVVGLNNCVEEFHLPRLFFLDAVVKETFRLHPALPLLVPHCPSQSCTVGGYTIPKGTAVFLNVYAIHRDPNLWDNPLEFRPDRYLNKQTTKFDYSGNNIQFLPFGSGRRICAGLPVAEKMLMYQLASLLHAFEWKLPNDTKPELSDKYGIVVKVLKPVVVIPTPRLSNLDLY
ncbi:hypothetical protein GH714_029629 [Hevea brasiliensis]|uniref:Cytochrome P450 n=1 Tax=Hevea brasiliensis TaxID=3981 RepID=A0A6A6LFB3_HEVBR|nr:hypothetical protein GH714_029629 [Hevea brasiliensis]